LYLVGHGIPRCPDIRGFADLELFPLGPCAGMELLESPPAAYYSFSSWLFGRHHATVTDQIHDAYAISRYGPAPRQLIAFT